MPTGKKRRVISNSQRLSRCGEDQIGRTVDRSDKEPDCKPHSGEVPSPHSRLDITGDRQSRGLGVSRSQVAAVTPRSRSRNFWILPFSVIGSAVRNSIKRGMAKAGMRPVQYSDSAAGVSTCPSRGTIATMTSSSASSERTGNAAASATSGCDSNTCSTSKDEIFSPRRRIASFIRSMKRKYPSASRTTRSPVWNHRLRHASTVFSGMPK